MLLQMPTEDVGAFVGLAAPAGYEGGKIRPQRNHVNRWKQMAETQRNGGGTDLDLPT
jgi:hypothetical protein